MSSINPKDLEQRIAAAKSKHEPDLGDKVLKARSDAMRLAVELISGVVVGLFMGYWADLWLDTKPIFFIIGFFLGVAAGAWNIYKLAKRND